MTIRRASVILPGRGLDEFPSHLSGQTAADLLAAVTSLWHPALIHATQALPGIYSTDEPPDPASLQGELVVVPSAARERLPADWCERIRATEPQNPPPVDAVPSRTTTIGALLAAASLDADRVSLADAADFLALGYAHLQVELLTRALRYTSVLDADEFSSAVVAAANAAVIGNRDLQQEELARAFDLLADARNHVYSVDFYVVDITLVTDAMLGTPLRAKLASGAATNLLVTGEQLDRMARENPDTLAELKRALEAGTASLVGGMYHGGGVGGQSPEALLVELASGQDAARRHLDKQFNVYGQFNSDFSPLLPVVLKNMGFRGALHAAFDGGGLPKADQRKTNWGEEHNTTIETLAAVPLDASQPEIWLKLAERIGDTIAHDHVATILLAGWPGAASDHFEDLRRAARFGPVLGKLVTLDSYFSESREADEWTRFYPREYTNRPGTEFGSNPISSRVAAYRNSAGEVQQQVGSGLAKVAGFNATVDASTPPANSIVLNPWNVAGTHFVGANILPSASASSPSVSAPLYLPDMPGCGYATFASAASPPRVALVEKLALRNEWMELTVSHKTGGIQSLRRHTDRNTRVSQRIVFHHLVGDATPETRMIADKVEVTRNEPFVGEITSRGRIMDAGKELLARYTQRVRTVRGLPVAIVDIELAPERLPDGNIWKSYFASRLAWADEALGFRYGQQWSGRETSRECIESSEWIEVDDGIGSITCYALGLPFHRIPALARLDSLLLVAGEEGRRFQFALTLDRQYPTHGALSLLSAVEPYVCASPQAPSSPHGWFLHVGSKNVLCTHVEPLPPPANGIRLRLLETTGRHTQSTLSAFRPFREAWLSDFRGNRTDVLSVTEGRAEFDMAAYGWLQIEAEL